MLVLLCSGKMIEEVLTALDGIEVVSLVDQLSTAALVVEISVGNIGVMVVKGISSA